MHYVLRLKFHERNYFLIWEDGHKEEDRLIIDAQMSGFVSAQSMEELMNKIKSTPDIHLADQKPDDVDMDAVFKALASLRPMRTVSEQKCRVLLNGWNLLRDMHRSIPNVTKPRFDQGKVIEKAYDKIFWGNNLPAVTPSGCSYSPLFSSRELKEIRKSFRRLWLEIRQWSGQFD